jgi:hypothetical protein
MQITSIGHTTVCLIVENNNKINIFDYCNCKALTEKINSFNLLKSLYSILLTFSKSVIRLFEILRLLLFNFWRLTYSHVILFWLQKGPHIFFSPKDNFICLWCRLNEDNIILSIFFSIFSVIWCCILLICLYFIFQMYTSWNVNLNILRKYGFMTKTN